MKLNNDLLRTKVKPVDFSVDDPNDIYLKLYNKLVESKHGLGLSANQIGIDKAALVFGNSAEPSSIEVMFNPKIVSFSEQKMKMVEGCLSYPGLYAKVDRSLEIRVRFQDLTGETKTATFNGMTARILQHECDHLNGLLFTDGMSTLQLRRALDKASRNGYHYKMNDLRLKD